MPEDRIHDHFRFVFERRGFWIVLIQEMVIKVEENRHILDHWNDFTPKDLIAEQFLQFVSIQRIDFACFQAGNEKLLRSRVLDLIDGRRIHRFLVAHLR